MDVVYVAHGILVFHTSIIKVFWPTNGEIPLVVSRRRLRV